MPVTLFTGLPRAGKTYDVVVSKILPAAKQNRRILTSVTGLNQAAISLAIGGGFVDVRLFTKKEVMDPESYPLFDDDGLISEQGKVVKPFDTIVLDEIHMYWGDSNRVADKIPERIATFFRYHGKIGCEIVLITHHPDDVPPFIRRVVDATVDVLSMRNLGMSSRYRRVKYARGGHDDRMKLGTDFGKLDPRKFHLYRSISVDGAGAVKAAAKSSRFMIAVCMVAISFAVGGFALYRGVSGMGPNQQVAAKKPPAAKPIPVPEPGKVVTVVDRGEVKDPASLVQMQPMAHPLAYPYGYQQQPQLYYGPNVPQGQPQAYYQPQAMQPIPVVVQQPPERPRAPQMPLPLSEPAGEYEFLGVGS